MTRLSQTLQINRIPLRDQAVLIFGAGGRRAALTSCLVEGAAKIGVYNRTGGAQDMIDKFVVRAEKVWSVSDTADLFNLRGRALQRGIPVVLQTTLPLECIPTLMESVDDLIFDQVSHVADMVFNGVNQICQDGKGTRIPAVGGFVNALFYQGLDHTKSGRRGNSRKQNWKPCMKNF